MKDKAGAVAAYLTAMCGLMNMEWFWCVSLLIWDSSVFGCGGEEGKTERFCSRDAKPSRKLHLSRADATFSLAAAKRTPQAYRYVQNFEIRDVEVSCLSYRPERRRRSKPLPPTAGRRPTIRKDAGSSGGDEYGTAFYSWMRLKANGNNQTPKQGTGRPADKHSYPTSPQQRPSPTSSDHAWDPRRC